MMLSSTNPDVSAPDVHIIKSLRGDTLGKHVHCNYNNNYRAKSKIETYSNEK